SAINIGTGSYSGTLAIGNASADVSLTDANWSISTGGLITTSNNAAINGGTISSSTTLTLDATSTVIIPDADTFQSNDLTSTSGVALATGANGNIATSLNGSRDVVATLDSDSNFQFTGCGADSVNYLAL